MAFTDVTRKTKAVMRMGGGEIALNFFCRGDNFAGKMGEWVCFSNGKVVRASADGFLLGILAADVASATSDTSWSTPVVLATPDTIFEAHVHHTTSGSALTTMTQIGKSFAIVKSAVATADAIDIVTGAAATDQCHVIGFCKDDAVGDKYGRVQFVINMTNSSLYTRVAH